MLSCSVVTLLPIDGDPCIGAPSSWKIFVLIPSMLADIVGIFLLSSSVIWSSFDSPTSIASRNVADCLITYVKVSSSC